MHHTGVGIQSFYLLVTFIFYRSFLFFDYTMDVLARTRVFSSHGLSTTPCSPVSDGFDEASSERKKLSVDRERAKKCRATEEVYTLTTSLSFFASLFSCFVCFCFVSASAGGDCNESRTRGIHILEVKSLIDDIEILEEDRPRVRSARPGYVDYGVMYIHT
jgi:hypothetical protein